MDILEFLPVYSNIDNDRFDSYEIFNQSTFAKKEFHDEKIEKGDIPKAGELFKGQRFIMKFLSSYTPYDQLLLFHEMGVGKSRATIAAIENIKKEDYPFDGAIIIAKGDSLLKNFQKEITDYTDDYMPENYEYLSDDLKKRRLNASLKKFYNFQTFITFANYLNGIDDKTIKEKYSNKIIVIDEVHNLTEDLAKNTKNVWLEEDNKSWYNPATGVTVDTKPENMNKSWIALRDKNGNIFYKKLNKDPKKEITQKNHPFHLLNPYKIFHRMLHVVKNCKIIILSGTPMKDSFKEIASLMNLILPLGDENQLPVKNEFSKTFFEKKGEFYDIKEDKKDELKSKLKGRVSYLKAVSSEIQKIFVGKKIKPLKYFTTFPSQMSEFQTEVYKKAYEEDTKNRKNKIDIEDMSTVADDEDSKYESGGDEESDDESDESGDSDDDESGDEKEEEEAKEEEEKEEEEKEEDDDEKEEDNEKEEEEDNEEERLANDQKMRLNATEFLHESIVKYNYNGNQGYGIVLRTGFKPDFEYDDRYIYVSPIIFQIENNDVDILDIDNDNLLKLQPDDIEYKIVDSINDSETFRNRVLSDFEENYNNVPNIIPSHVPFKKQRRVRNKLKAMNDKTKRKLYFDGKKKEKGESSFYYHSRHSSLFVFPDGSYGKDGFNKYVKETKGKFTLSQNLKQLISGKTDEEKIEKLRKFSCKYAEVIEKIINAYESKKSSFVYCNSVTGGGLILFSLILELFGFQKAIGYEKTRKRRYALFLTGKSDFSALKERFNNADNKHGEFINVILGSRSISEGLSFLNIREEHIITPHYNYGEIEQAIARGYRSRSHLRLIEDCRNKLIEKGYEYDTSQIGDINQIIEDCKTEGIEYPDLKVFQHVAIPNDKTMSVDVVFYKISEVKDVNIKKVERLMKEAAVDCAINKERNMVVGYDDERDCEYMECQYECDDIPVGFIPEIDYTTDFVHYFNKSESYTEIKNEIMGIFRKKFRLDFSILSQMFPNYKYNYLLKVLYDIIVNKEIIYSKYGIPCYLKESNNIFFLTDNFSDNDALVEYYTKNPNLVREDSFNEAYRDLVDENASNLIELILHSNVDNQKSLRNMLSFIQRLDMETQEILLEYCIIADEKEVIQNEKVRNYLLREVFVGKYKKIKGVYISWMLFIEKLQNYEKLRFLDDINGEWRDAESDEDVLLFRSINEASDVEEIKRNPYGYYGIFDKNKKTNETKFKIVKILEEQTTKKNKIPSGKVCQTYNTFELIDILERLEIYPSEEKMKEDIESWEILQNKSMDEIKSGSSVKLREQLEKMTDEDKMRRYVFWNGKDREKVLCIKILNGMKEKRLII